MLFAYSTLNKLDVICSLESHLDSSITSDNDDLNIKGCKLQRADHLNNVKKGGVCAYTRESLLVRCLSIHIYKNVLYWKYLSIKKRLRFFTISIP